MKSCPQCEFIYEDDQSLCDMDGVLLVFDSQTLPNLHALATISAPLPGKTARRNRMVPAFATLILMLAVGSVYYVSTMRNAAPNNFSSAGVPTTSAAAAPAIEPTAEAVIEPAREITEKPETPAPVETKSTTTPEKKATVTKPVATKPAPAPKKDDSKVESIIKKTGKILKKPFKF